MRYLSVVCLFFLSALLVVSVSPTDAAVSTAASRLRARIPTAPTSSDDSPIVEATAEPTPTVVTPQLEAVFESALPVEAGNEAQIQEQLEAQQTAEQQLPQTSPPQTAEQQTTEQQIAEQQTAEQQAAEQQAAEQQAAEQQAAEQGSDPYAEAQTVDQVPQQEEAVPPPPPPQPLPPPHELKNDIPAWSVVPLHDGYSDHFQRVHALADLVIFELNDAIQSLTPTNLLPKNDTRGFKRLGVIHAVLTRVKDTTVEYILDMDVISNNAHQANEENNREIFLVKEFGDKSVQVERVTSKVKLP